MRVGRTLAATVVAGCVATMLASEAPAQTAYKIGVSGAATGPASPSYLPHIEGLRIYLRQLNDKGGINGKRLDVI
jgi:branched-chain amino acid transport system substrate-binding protein